MMLLAALFAILVAGFLPATALAQFGAPMMMVGGKDHRDGSHAIITGVSASCDPNCGFTAPATTGRVVGILSATVTNPPANVTFALSAGSAVFTNLTTQCGSNCTLSAQTPVTVSTSSTAILSGGTPAVTWNFRTSGTDDTIGHAACSNNTAALSINSSTGAITSTTGGRPKVYTGTCIQATQTGVSNSPYAVAISSIDGRIPPPTTAQGNYATGCSGGTCLTFDDAWTSGTLNTANWYPGWSSCNNGSAENCVSVPGGGGYAFPLSGGCWGNNGSCQDVGFYPYPYGYSTNTSPVLTHVPLAVAADGSLAFGAKLYSSTVQPTASNNPLASSPYCNSVPFSAANCAFIYWTSAGITSGGVNGSNNTVNNTTAILPITGGIFQWRMKLDAGVLNGMYAAMECDAVGGASKGLNINGNFEFGYKGGTGALHAVGISINNTAIGASGNVYPVNTGDNGIGGGDLTNWHVYALEWTGSATHAFHYYIDGAEMPVTSNNEATVPTVGWTCTLKQGVAQNQTQGGCHTLWDTGHPGPYFMWVSEAQLLKKPGT